MKRHKLLGLSIAAACLAMPVSAQAFTCQVNPQSYLGVSGSGLVVVGVEGVGILQICSMVTETAGVTKEACTAWYSALLTWRETGKTGTLYFEPTNVGGATSCTQFSQWDLRMPYYMDAL